MATTPDYPILGPPRISYAGFAAVLQANRSPATGEAPGCYRAFTDAGVDPAVGLAIFRKESTFGKYGKAASTRSWGNIREPSGAFRIYSSWTAGARDAARLLTVYGSNRIRPGRKTDTVQTMPYVWAPSSDGNAPDAYGDKLASWIGQWSTKYPAAGSSAPPLAGAPVPNADQASSSGGVVLTVFNGATVGTCSDVTIVAPTNGSQDLSGVYPIPRALVGQPCVQCSAGWVPAIVSVGPVQTVQGYVSPQDAPGKANACVKAGTNPGDRPGVGGVPGQVVDSIPGAIAAFGDALANIVTHGIVFIGLLAIVVLGLYLVATSER